MPLTSEAVEELREILRREYNAELSDQEAWEAALNLFNFLNAIIRMDSSMSDNSSKNAQSETPRLPLPL